jgi:hypothetical protein
MATVDAYSVWTKTLVADGWKPYFVNFMFKSLATRHSLLGDPMEAEVCRVYGTLITNVVRDPRKEIGKLPVFWGSPDFPIFRRQKVIRRDFQVNCGRHYNGLFFIPLVCRLHCSLGDHFEEHSKWYVGQGRPLQRIHTTEMTYGNMADYALKAFKSGRVTYDNVLVLPRALSELPANGERKSHQDTIQYKISTCK